eukprot:GSChrysophyteH1.ASY1.ANO1.623.1 assembled CDS
MGKIYTCTYKKGECTLEIGIVYSVTFELATKNSQSGM